MAFLCRNLDETVHAAGDWGAADLELGSLEVDLLSTDVSDQPLELAGSQRALQTLQRSICVFSCEGCSRAGPFRVELRVNSDLSVYIAEKQLHQTYLSAEGKFIANGRRVHRRHGKV